MANMNKTGKGFLTLVQDNETTDYLKLAYAQALSIKTSQTTVKSYAVVADKATIGSMTDQHREVFDHIIELPVDLAANESWKLSNEWQLFRLTPYYETLKVESDLLFTTDIHHWWPVMQKHEVLMSSKIYDYEGNVSDCRAYRQLFDDNDLPDVYTGLMYFRYSQTAAVLFGLA